MLLSEHRSELRYFDLKLRRVIFCTNSSVVWCLSHMAWVDQTGIIRKEMSVLDTVNHRRTMTSKRTTNCILDVFVSLFVCLFGTETFRLPGIQMSWFPRAAVSGEATNLPADGVLSGKIHSQEIES